MSLPTSLTENFEISGTWWLSENPENRILGTIKVSHKKITLELEGSFEQISGFQSPPYRPIILGELRNEMDATLFQCSFISLIGGLRHQNVTYVIGYLFLGCHFINEESITFNRISLKFSKLDSWIQIHGFNATDTDGLFSISYTPPETITVEINENLSLSIFFGVSHSISTSSKREETISQSISIQLATNNEFNFFEFLKLIQHLRNFLSLGIMGPEYITSMTGFSNEFLEGSEESRIERSIFIYYAQGDLPDTSFVNETNMLFTFRQIQNNFETYIRKWFERIETFEMVGNVYFGTMYNSNSYLHEKFLSIVSALESFHRIFRDGTIWDNEHFEAIKTKLVESVAAEDREEIRTRFRYANEPYLRRRLRSIIDEFQFFLGNESGFNASFIGLVVDTRNYYTHYDLELRNNIIENQRLPRFIARLRILMEAAFLSELGFEQETIANLMRRSMIQKRIPAQRSST